MKKLLEFIQLEIEYFPRIWAIAGHSHLTILMAAECKKDKEVMNEISEFANKKVAALGGEILRPNRK